MTEPILPPLKPIPIKDRISVAYAEKGNIDVLDGAFVVVDKTGVRTQNPVGLTPRAGSIPAFGTTSSPVFSICYDRIPLSKTVTRLSLGRLSRRVKGSGLSSCRWSCFTGYRSVVEMRRLRRPRSTD